ncbi:MAG: response regulator transcription factor [Clostridia bacterium]|jgi:two-component system, OmpR family, response regulator ResD|nr:response regulator transcription factor [Clostridia bacterium]
MCKKILVADDEGRIRSVISDFLTLEGYEVVEAADGREAFDIFESDPTIKIVILDVMMPYMSGFEVCSKIRKRSDLPIIMLTAKTEEPDELTGFGRGADEYIKKPFKASILVARVNALYTRVYGNPEKDYIQRGSLRIYVKEQSLTVDDVPITLSSTELKLLMYMIKHENVALSRERLLDNIWSYEYDGTDRTVDTTINRLRSKLSKASIYIKTVPKSGYKFKAGEDTQ